MDLKKKVRLREVVLPNKRMNYFVGTILGFGIISGSIFLMLSSEADQGSVVQAITSFFLNVQKGGIDNGLAFRNSLIINYLFIISIFILGLSMIGVFFNFFLAYLKGFLVGFSIASIFLTYHVKGIIGVLLYTFPSQVINLFLVFLMTVYSMMFSLHLMKIILSKKGNQRKILKRYLIILVFSIIFSFLSSLLEVYVFPKILKVFISFYVK